MVIGTTRRRHNNFSSSPSASYESLVVAHQHQHPNHDEVDSEEPPLNSPGAAPTTAAAAADLVSFMSCNKITNRNGTEQQHQQQLHERKGGDRKVWSRRPTKTANRIFLLRRQVRLSTWGRHAGLGFLWIVISASIILLVLGLLKHHSTRMTTTTTSSSSSSQNIKERPRIYPSLRRVPNHQEQQLQQHDHQQQQQQHQHAIPNILIFTHRWNLWSKENDWNNNSNSLPDDERRELLALQANVHRIAALHPTAQVRFLTDDDCRASLRRVPLFNDNNDNTNNNNTERLIQYFDHEKQGMFKADLCRGAALYETGGVYLDVDLGVRLDLFDVLNRTTEFATVKVHKQSKYPGAFFQAFWAATPHHTVVLRYVELFWQHYQGTLQPEPIRGGPLGVLLLKRAYDEIEAEQQLLQQQPQEPMPAKKDTERLAPRLTETTTTTTTHLNATTELWQEALYLPELRDTLLRDIPPPTWGTRRACKFIVIARPSLPLQVPMYSRIAGSRMCPENNNNNNSSKNTASKSQAADDTTPLQEQDGADDESDMGNVEKLAAKTR